MVLGGVGDALGYRNGRWEFCMEGERIHEEARAMGGVAALKSEGNRVSDDTVMHLATAEALVRCGAGERTALLLELARKYVKCFGDMRGRAPGPTTGAGVAQLRALLAANAREVERRRRALDPSPVQKKRRTDDDGDSGDSGDSGGGAGDAAGAAQGPWRTPVARTGGGGGCGGCMRAVPIGLAYPLARPSTGPLEAHHEEHERDIRALVAVAVESCRMTHNHPTGYLGTVAAALFTALALQGVPLASWGRLLLDTVPLAHAYVREQEPTLAEWDVKNSAYFVDAWRAYLEARDLLDGIGPPSFPAAYGVAERDAFYTSVSYSGWGGASGHDAPMIAYDALLGAGKDWAGDDGVVARGVLHGGDNDSTGILAGAWYGAMHGFDGVPPCHTAGLEYHDRLMACAKGLWREAKRRHPQLLALLARTG